MLLLITIHEKRALPLEEDSVGLLFVCVGERAFAVHLAVLPLARVHAAVGPLEGAIAVPLVIQVVSLVYSAVRPSVLAATVHVARVPLSDVLPPIEPLVSSMALHLIVDPVAGVEGAIRPEIRPEAILLPQAEVTVKSGAISPAFDSITVIQVIFPLANITLLAILRLKVPEAICLIVLPIALVSVPIRTP